MPAKKKPGRSGIYALSPLKRIYRIAKARAQRARNLHELERLDSYMREDIGMYN